MKLFLSNRIALFAFGYFIISLFASCLAESGSTGSSSSSSSGGCSETLVNEKTDDGDCLVYLYATDSGTTLDLIPDTDFFFSNWDTGTNFQGEYAGDTDYGKVFQVAGAGSGSSWGTVFALYDFDAGFAGNYVNLIFKIKGVSSIEVAFTGDGVSNNETAVDLTTSSYAEDISGTTGWKQVSFPFPTSHADVNSYTQFAIFTRDSSDIFYLTDIAFSGAASTSDSSSDSTGDSTSDTSATAPTDAPADPTHDAANVISIYSDTYTDLSGTNFNASWGQATQYSTETIASNNVIKLSSFNYHGIELSGNNSLALMEYLHIDMWTPDAAQVKITPINNGGSPVENLLDIASASQPVGTHGTWVSVDIPISDFTANGMSVSAVHQIKFDGQFDGSGGADTAARTTIYLDNIYFWKNPSAAGTDATLSDLQIDGVTVAGFDSATTAYNVDMSYDASPTVPTVTATTNDGSAAAVVTDAGGIPGSTTIVVTAADSSTTLTYTINFGMTAPEPSVAGPVPTDTGEISIFGDTYTQISSVNLNPGWGQSTTTTTETIGGDSIYKMDRLNYQGIDFSGNTQDVSGKTNLHIDYWVWIPGTSSVTSFQVFLVGGGETAYTISNPTQQSWQSLDIPLTDYSGVDLTQVIQIKFDIPNHATVDAIFEPTVYVSNIYFH